MGALHDGYPHCDCITQAPPSTAGKPWVLKTPFYSGKSFARVLLLLRVVTFYAVVLHAFSEICIHFLRSETVHSKVCGLSKHALKYDSSRHPRHQGMLKELVAEYPDARMIMTHRRPIKAMSSLSSLQMRLRSVSSDLANPKVWIEMLLYCYYCYCEKAVACDCASTAAYAIAVNADVRTLADATRNPPRWHVRARVRARVRAHIETDDCGRDVLAMGHACLPCGGH